MNNWYDVFCALLKDGASYVECDVPSHWFDAKRYELAEKADHFWYTPSGGTSPWCLAMFEFQDAPNVIIFFSTQEIVFAVADIEKGTLSSTLYNKKLNAETKSALIVTQMRDAPDIKVTSHLRLSILSRVSA